MATGQVKGDHQMKSYRSFIELTALLLIPILISFIVHLFFTVSFGLILSILYAIFVFFSLPSDTTFSQAVDYQTKVSNPTHRLPLIKHLAFVKMDWIRFLLLLIALIVTLVTWYIIEVNI